tara:strand:+ start:62 stop:328 length:267 start_codon:yes stop_codon:yes gene_type:complete
MSSSKIEKENLEAHVELCAERYKALENKLSNLDKRLDTVETHVIAIRETINKSTGGMNKQTINVLAAAVGIFLTAILGLLLTLVDKLA